MCKPCKNQLFVCAKHEKKIVQLEQKIYDQNIASNEIISNMRNELLALQKKMPEQKLFDKFPLALCEEDL